MKKISLKCTLVLFLFLASCGFRPMYKQTPYNDLSKKMARQEFKNNSINAEDLINI